MADWVIDKVETVLAPSPGEDFQTTMFVHDQDFGDKAIKYVTYADPDGLAAAFYANPLNAGDTLVDVPAP